MNLNSAAAARKLANAGAKQKSDIGSKRVQAIYATLKEKAEMFSHVASSEPFPGSASDSVALQNAFAELAGNRSLKKGMESEMIRIFKKLGWPIPAEDEDDNSKRFGPRHGWNRELKRRVAELKEGSSTGGSEVVRIGPREEAVLAATEEHLKGGVISDKALQDANKALKRCGRGA
jgi:hypothetical protein